MRFNSIGASFPLFRCLDCQRAAPAYLHHDPLYFSRGIERTLRLAHDPAGAVHQLNRHPVVAEGVHTASGRPRLSWVAVHDQVDALEAPHIAAEAALVALTDEFK
ncbi:MAG: hypothetical protein V3V96_04800 [Acidiferrobacterales bacterium]